MFIVRKLTYTLVKCWSHSLMSEMLIELAILADCYRNCESISSQSKHQLTCDVNYIIGTSLHKVNYIIGTSLHKVNYIIGTSLHKVNYIIGTYLHKVNNIIGTSLHKVNYIIGTSLHKVNYIIGTYLHNQNLFPRWKYTLNQLLFKKVFSTLTNISIFLVHSWLLPLSGLEIHNVWPLTIRGHTWFSQQSTSSLGKLQKLIFHINPIQTNVQKIITTIFFKSK